MHSNSTYRWTLRITALAIVFIAYAIWSRQNYLAELRREESGFNQELQDLLRRNRELQKKVETLEGMVREKLTRQDVEIKISKLRELPFRKPVSYRTMPRSDFKNYVLSKLRSEYTPEEFHNYELALKRIGLLPMNIDLVQTVSDLFSEQVAAFYDPDTHELYTFPDLSLNNNFERMILAHELVHALQDQNFNFRSLALKARDNDDAATAASALVEGDATYSMGAYLRENYRAHQLLGDLRQLFSQPMDRYLSAPPWLRDSMVFPYQEGQMFVAAVHAAGGNSAIDALFANPPQSTEQVLHPQKYMGPGKDLPKTVGLGPKINPSWKKLHENVVGELGIRSLFSESLGPDKSYETAYGWGGDRYALYEVSSEKWVLVWKSVWDTEKDAREFFDSLEALYRKRYDTSPAAVPPSGRSNGSEASTTTGGGFLAKAGKPEARADAIFFSEASQKQNITIRGRTVLFLNAPDSRTMSLILEDFNREN